MRKPTLGENEYLNQFRNAIQEWAFIQDPITLNVPVNKVVTGSKAALPNNNIY